MNDLTDITIFNASASCSKCTIRRQNEPISDRTTMQFLLNDQCSLNAKSQKENEQKGGTKKKSKKKKTRNPKEKMEIFTKKRTNGFI